MRARTDRLGELRGKEVAMSARLADNRLPDAIGMTTEPGGFLADGTSDGSWSPIDEQSQ